MEQLYRTQFRARRQNSGKTVQQFSTDVLKFTKLAYQTLADDILKNMAIDVFTGGLRNAEVQQALKLSRQNTMG